MTVESDPDEDTEVGVPGSNSFPGSVLLVEGDVRIPLAELPDANGVWVPTDISPASVSVQGVYRIDRLPDLLYASIWLES